MSCSKCGNPFIVNKFFNLCRSCNNERLHGDKYGNVAKTQKKIDADDEFYEECFDGSNHRCEECGERLNVVFRDDDGRVACRWRYSHILPKSTHPEFRHNILNINHLCMKHHHTWDFGNKESMKIYESNQERIKQLKHGDT